MIVLTRIITMCNFMLSLAFTLSLVGGAVSVCGCGVVLVVVVDDDGDDVILACHCYLPSWPAACHRPLNQPRPRQVGRKAS